MAFSAKGENIQNMGKKIRIRKNLLIGRIESVDEALMSELKEIYKRHKAKNKSECRVRLAFYHKGDLYRINQTCIKHNKETIYEFFLKVNHKSQKELSLLKKLIDGDDSLF